MVEMKIGETVWGLVDVGLEPLYFFLCSCSSALLFPCVQSYSPSLFLFLLQSISFDISRQQGSTEETEHWNSEHSPLPPPSHTYPASSFNTPRSTILPKTLKYLRDSTTRFSKSPCRSIFQDGKSVSAVRFLVCDF